MKALRIVRSGLLTTVQDLGRPGLGSIGVPPSGAADSRSAALANHLAGNAAGAAVLEMTAAGAHFEALAEARIAFAGAAMPASRNGERLPGGRCHELRPGDRLEFGTAAVGFRTYLAAEGGFDVPKVLGSRSTLVAAGFGGYQGRRLESGDVLEVFPGGPAALAGREEAIDAPPRRSPITLRALRGPQAELFPEESLAGFERARFRVSARSDRMGLRLEGDKIAAAGEAEIASEGVVVGSVQVPAGGDPIVLMPDGPVTGGYPKIACVASVDLPLLGQVRPGDELRFVFVPEADALAALAREGAFLVSAEEAQ
jgi:antagonist of KipI